MPAQTEQAQPPSAADPVGNAAGAPAADAPASAAQDAAEPAATAPVAPPVAAANDSPDSPQGTAAPTPDTEIPETAPVAEAWEPDPAPIADIPPVAPSSGARIPAQPAAKAADPAGSGETSGEDFEDAQGILARLDTQDVQEKTVAKASAGPATVGELDSQLAARAQQAMADDDDPAPSLPQPKPPPPAPPHSEPPAPAPAAAPKPADPVVAAPAPSPPPKPAATRESSSKPAKLAPAPQAAPEHEAQTPVVHASVLRRLAAFIGRMLVKAATPLAVRFNRLGPESRKIVKLTSAGTLAQAIFIWCWLLFVRSPLPAGGSIDPAAPGSNAEVSHKEAPHAKPGAEHGEKKAEAAHAKPASRSKRPRKPALPQTTPKKPGAHASAESGH
jgi:hypothetical protein